MYVAFDIGGTKMRIAVSKDAKTLLREPFVEKTPPRFEDGISHVTDIIRELTGGKQITAIAGGIAGSFNREKTMLFHAPNLPGWVGKPLVETLSKNTKAPVYAVNDTAIVGLGEAYAGAGMGYSIVAYITVSTGVGGVRIIDKVIDKRAFGFEPGHQIIDADGSLCPDCASGQLEDLISGTAVSRRFDKPAVDVVHPSLWSEELPRWLAFGLYNTVLYWSPDVIVLGGSMIVGEPAINIERTKQYLRDITTVFPEIPEIKKAECGDIGGIHGAFAYLRQQHR